MTKVYELDIVTEDISLDDAVAEIAAIEGVSIILVSSSGFGSGWPTVKLSADEAGLAKLEEWYGSEIEE